MGAAAKWRLGRQSQVPGMHGGGPVCCSGSVAPGVGREEEVFPTGAGADCPKLVTIPAASVLPWG